jgi:signal transduction histidine kinase/CheY-like chemotaxis protein
MDQTEISFLIEKNADGIIVVDEEGIVLFVNPAAERLFARSAASLIGSPIGIPFVAGDNTEITIRRPGSGQIDAEIRVVETTWNHRPALLASLRDISARKSLDERLRHAAKMEAVGQLTAGIAHDFNNLLTVVLGNLETAKRKAEVADPSLMRALENAMHGARRATELTQRLLSFARRKPLEPRTLDVNALVSGMSDLLQRTLGESINVRTVLAPDLWNVEVDPTELEAAILNLAVNARDVMAGGGDVTIETSNVELEAAYANANVEAKPGPHVLISVTDTGSGMTPDVLKRAFEPFFTTKAHGQGTGLGLSQVYGFVVQSGGHIKAYSEPGIGTTIRIYFPRTHGLRSVERHEAAAPADVEQAPRARPGETILVVEDDDDVRSYTVGSLRELGYTVLQAVDAASALKVIEREPNIGLLFTDLGLPGGVDGKELADRAREMRRSLRVLITTAYAGKTLVHAGRLDAGVALLNKPFSFAALAVRIREVLDTEAKQEQACFLVVDDEPLLRAFVVDVLEDAGCRAEEAGSFREAMAKMRKVGHQLAGAIIDLGLPDRPGDELITEIRALQPDLPIVLATGFADASVRERISQDSRARCLTKPFDPDTLVTVLRGLGIEMDK